MVQKAKKWVGFVVLAFFIGVISIFLIAKYGGPNLQWLVTAIAIVFGIAIFSALIYVNFMCPKCHKFFTKKIIDKIDIAKGWCGFSGKSKVYHYDYIIPKATKEDKEFISDDTILSSSGVGEGMPGSGVSRFVIERDRCLCKSCNHQWNQYRIREKGFSVQVK